MHKTFANHPKAAAFNAQNGIVIDDICPLTNDLPIFEPTKHKDDPPGIPDDMPLCVDMGAKLNDLSKEKVIDECIRLNDAMKHDWRRSQEIG